MGPLSPQPSLGSEEYLMQSLLACYSKLNNSLVCFLYKRLSPKGRSRAANYSRLKTP